MALFLPKPGYSVRITETGEFSAQQPGAVGKVVTARESTSFPGWLEVDLEIAPGRFWVSMQCRARMALLREVA